MGEERGNGPSRFDLPLQRLLIKGLNQRQQPVLAFRVLPHDIRIHGHLLSRR